MYLDWRLITPRYSEAIESGEEEASSTGKYDCIWFAESLSHMALMSPVVVSEGCEPTSSLTCNDKGELLVRTRCITFPLDGCIKCVGICIDEQSLEVRIGNVG